MVAEGSDAMPVGGTEPEPEMVRPAPVAQKVRWTDDEARQVAAEIARLLRKQGIRFIPQENDRVGRQFLTEFLAAAQLKLPRHRQRLQAKASQMGIIFWKLVEDALTGRETPQPAPQEPNPISALPAEPAAPAGPEVNGHAKPVPPEGQVLLNGDDPLGNVPLEVLLRALSRRMLGEQARMRELEHTLAQVQEWNDLKLAEDSKREEQWLKRISAIETELINLRGAARAKYPRVGIFGCQKHQFDHVKAGVEAAKLPVELRYYEQEASVHQISADYAISMRFVGHDTEGQITAVVPKERYRFIAGGIGAVIDQLREWFPPAKMP